jgi:hypothetical protein
MAPVRSDGSLQENKRSKQNSQQGCQCAAAEVYEVIVDEGKAPHEPVWTSVGGAGKLGEDIGACGTIQKTIKTDFQSEAARSGMHTLEELNTAFWAVCTPPPASLLQKSLRKAPLRSFKPPPLAVVVDFVARSSTAPPAGE